MKQERTSQNSINDRMRGAWGVLWNEGLPDKAEAAEKSTRGTERFADVPIPTGASARDLDVLARDDLKTGQNIQRLAENSQMTIATFVQDKFLTEHVALKRSTGRAYYLSMLKHILTPEEVGSKLCKSPHQRGNALTAIPGWPYIGTVRLCDARPEHVSRLISAALAHGYSNQTVTHIRSVVRAIFSHAQRTQCFYGVNPVRLVNIPPAPRKEASVLTLSEAKKALESMRYPEKEMMLIAIFTGMSPGEIAGLQWGQINLTMKEARRHGVQIPPRTIAIRSHWLRGKLEPVRDRCLRNIRIALPLLKILLERKARPNFTGADDFVLVSRAGTPINQNNILRRQLRAIAEQMGAPSLSFRNFSRIRDVLVSELEMQHEVPPVMIASAAPARVISVLSKWRCPSHRRRIHSTDGFSFRSR